MVTGMSGRQPAGRCHHGPRVAADQLRAALLPALLAVLAAPCAAEPAYVVHADVVIVHADRAWENDSGPGMRFAGDLSLRGRDWRIEADSAELAGGIDDPERVVVDGAPARIVVTVEGSGEPVEGRSSHLEFEPDSETLRLEGAAMLVRGQQSVSSERIEYQLSRGTFAAGSHGRVRVVMRPQRD